MCRSMCAGQQVQGNVCRTVCSGQCLQSSVYRTVCAGQCVQGYMCKAMYARQCVYVRVCRYITDRPRYESQYSPNPNDSHYHGICKIERFLEFNICHTNIANKENEVTTIMVVLAYLCLSVLVMLL